MSFAQPIRRRPSTSTVSPGPGWLTTGIARSAGSTSGYGSSYATSAGGVSWSMNGGGSASGSGSGLSSVNGDWNFGSGRREAETSSRQHEQELINAYEAEEERIINVLSRKLEQLREDKIELENALEAESESHVNKLLRELGALRVANGELEARAAEAEERASTDGLENRSSSSARNPTHSGRKAIEDVTGRSFGTNPSDPNVRSLIDAMQRENELLRSRLVDAERNYIRLSRLNEIYREELIEHRTRLGLPLDNLAGLTASDRDPLSQPIHRRSTRDSRSSSISGSSSPAGPAPLGGTSAQLQGFIGATASPRNREVSIPRPPSQIHRPSQLLTSPIPISNSPSHPSQSPSPALYSPVDGYAPSSSSQSVSSSPVSPFVPLHSRTAPILLNSGRGGHSSTRRQDRRYSNASSTSFAGSLTDATSAVGADPASVSTGITSPPDSVIDGGLAGTFGGITPQRTLSYPSVPPPSLSSSFGSPAAIYQIHTHLVSQTGIRPRDSRDPSTSPVEARSRRGSMSQAGERRVAESGSLRRASLRANAGESPVLPIGGRVAETGSLVDVARSRTSSFTATADPTSSGTVSRPSTVIEGDAEDLEFEEL